MDDEFRIRGYEPGDFDAVYRVCLETGDAGQDATDLYADPNLLGHLYTGPYVTYEPELAFVLEDEKGVCGYTLGALESEPFYRRMADEWFPKLREKYPDPQGDSSQWSRDERLMHAIHHPEAPTLFDEYPSHLHIDIIARAQGYGLGGLLMDRLTDALQDKGSPGVHLGMAVTNDRAYGFYVKYGFTELQRDEDTIYMAMTL